MQLVVLVDFLLILEESIRMQSSGLCDTFVTLSDLKLGFGSGKPMLVGYTNADMVGDVDSRKFTFDYLITFLGGVVS